MKNDYYKYNYDYIYIKDNNIKINKNENLIIDNNKKIDKEYIFKDDNNNLSDVLSAIRSARSTRANQQSQTRVSTPIQPSNDTQPQTKTTAQSQTQNIQQPQIQSPNPGTVKPTNVTDARQLWSPVSLAGVIYKYNRGVIGIELDGTKHEIIFDGTFRHHNEATAEIGLKTNCPVTDKYANPFLNGMEVSKQGTIIIQLEGDSILVYLPEMISNEQYQSLESEVNPRSKFSTVAFSHGDDIYDDSEVNIEYLRNFYSNIVGAVRRTAR